jgi:hypothetical protein
LNGVSAGRAGRREWIGLAVLTLPAMLISMDLTVLHLAVPAVIRTMFPDPGQRTVAIGPALLGASRAAFVDGFQLVAACGVVIMFGLTVLAGFWLRQEQADLESAGHSAPTPDRLVAECACAR